MVLQAFGVVLLVTSGCAASVYIKEFVIAVLHCKPEVSCDIRSSATQ